MKPNVAAYLQFRYEKLRLLKQSAKGEVWLASNKSTGELAVMKIVNYTGLPYAALKNNPHALFAKIFYCAESETDTVVVEEFIQGETLEGRALTDADARKILLQLCDGLKFLHALGIIHRDIKPANMILQSGGIVRLIDFDAARTVKENQNTDTKFLGTKGYAPPEQYGFGQTDARSDIFSLGKTFLELTGENCGSQLKKILSKCVEVDPKNRWQSAAELRAALTKSNTGSWKIGALISAAAAGLFSLVNSTPAPVIPAETENVPAEVEEIPAPAVEPEPAPEFVEPTPEPEPVPEIVEPTPEPEPAPEINETLPAEPTPEPESPTENFQPSFPSNAPSLENFQPSFPQVSQLPQELGGVHLGEEISADDGQYAYENLTLTIRDNAVVEISTDSPEIQTPEGIRVGMAFFNVISTYGINYRRENVGSDRIYTYRQGAAEMIFVERNGSVASIIYRRGNDSTNSAQ